MIEEMVYVTRIFSLKKKQNITSMMENLFKLLQIF